MLIISDDPLNILVQTIFIKIWPYFPPIKHFFFIRLSFKGSVCHDNHDKLDFESSLPVLKIALSNKEKTKTYFSKMAETLKYSDASKVTPSNMQTSFF